MPGPPPKHPSQRRRRNAEAVGTTTLPAAKERTRTPALPGAAQLLASTRAWWKTAWESPMAAVWIDADVPALVRLARLVDLTTRQFQVVADGPVPHLSVGDLPDGVEVTVTFDSPVTAALLAEMRQLEDRLGLSPLSRRRLQWEIEQSEATDGGRARADELAAKRRERFEQAVGQ